MPGISVYPVQFSVQVAWYARRDSNLCPYFQSRLLGESAPRHVVDSGGLGFGTVMRRLGHSGKIRSASEGSVIIQTRTTGLITHQHGPDRRTNLTHRCPDMHSPSHSFKSSAADRTDDYSCRLPTYVVQEIRARASPRLAPLAVPGKSASLVVSGVPAGRLLSSQDNSQPVAACRRRLSRRTVRANNVFVGYPTAATSNSTLNCAYSWTF